MNKQLNRPLPPRTTLLISGLIVVAGLLAVVFIFNTEPEAEREAATRKAPMPVEVVETNYGNFAPTIVAMGSVRAEQDIVLRPRVAGQVLKRSERFFPGAYVKKGDVLLQIDPADYENAVALRRAELTQAQAAFKLEQAEQSIAERDYKALNKNLDPLQRSLVLREPQLQAAEAEVHAAQVNLAQAQLALQRTTLRAPFDAQILSREVSVGAQVTEGDPLARLIGLERYWVEAAIPNNKVHWLSTTTNVDVSIRHSAWPKHAQRSGQLKSVIGALEPTTRMARVLIEVNNPLALSSNNSPTGTESDVALAVGSYVEAQLPARTLNDVVKLDRDYLRKGDTAWVMESDTLSVRDLEVLFLDADHAYIGNGLAQGDMIVTTSLSRVRDGAALRLKNHQQESKDQPSSSDGDQP